MRYFGRFTIPLVAIFIIAVWHASYFIIDKDVTYSFLIKNGFLNYDFIYTPIILPFFWWMGKKYDEAKFYSERDTLTSLYNRRFVLKVFPSLLDRVRRTKQELSLFIVDVDDFKKINDTYGHEIGDKVIRDVSVALSQNTTGADLVARWGGDEFLVIMSHPDRDTYLSSLLVSIDRNLAVISERFNIPISVSIGCATSPENGELLNDLIRIADERMYAYKAGKRTSGGERETPL